MVLCGEAGSAKSKSSRVLRALIDPNAAPLRSYPHEIRDLMVAASNGWVLGFDNISNLPPWLSDAFCRIATGGGFAKRQNYTDMEEILIDVQRPLIINGIDEMVTRVTWLTVQLSCTCLLSARRTAEQSVISIVSSTPKGRRFSGLLLDGISCALERIEDGVIGVAPNGRLCGVGICGIARAEPGLDAFLDAYRWNLARAERDCH